MFLKWLIYLRKSRQDDPAQTIEEVLSKHEAILQEYARRELGGEIPQENIYREVVSGESIDDRIEIKKVLARLEDPEVAGVLVVEPSRLSRGDLADCAQIISAFRFSKTLVGTPMMVYNLENKMERKFFQDELLRGNDYLEYTKEILFRGRVAAVKRGCYIGQYAPFGYDKTKKGKDHTLEPNENADVVRMIFDWYVNEDLTRLQIARRLNDMGIKPARGEKWPKDTIRHILANPHYAGKVVFNRIKSTPVMENGVIRKKRLTQELSEVVVADGKHPAIIDWDIWERAQAKTAATPRVKQDRTLKNPLAGILFCSKCKRAMYIHPYKRAEDRYECRTKPRCFKSVKESELIDAVVYALEKSELPNLELKLQNNDGNAKKIQQRLLEKLEKQMAEYLQQEETQYELLETRKYTQDIFDRRNGALRKKMEECQAAIYKTKATMPQEVDYEERIVALRAAISTLRESTPTPAQKNRLLKAIVERIEYTGPAGIDPNNRRGFKKNHTPFTLEITLRL